MPAGNDIGQLSLRQAYKCFNKKLLLTCCLVAISPFNYGFDNQGFSSIQSMDYFDKQFGDYDPKTKAWYLPTWWLSIFNAVPFASFFCGIICGSIISKKFGRRACIFFMACWALMSASVIISARSRGQILAGRILNFFYVGMELVCIAVYQSEITPRKVRGVTVGAYHVALTTGGLILNSLAAGTKEIKSNASWIIPFGLFFTIPTIIVSTIWFLPESPRCLIMQERTEQARKNLHVLRVGALTEEQIEEEWQQMLLGIRQEEAISKKGCNVSSSAPTSAAPSLSSSSTSSSSARFYMLIIMAIINMFLGFVVIYAQDRIGRRKLLFIGGGVQASAMICMGGLGTAPDQSLPIRNAVVSMMVIYISGYTAGWAGVTQTMNAEIPSTELRAATFRVASITAVVCQIVMTFVIPYLLNAPYAALHVKTGFIFGAITVCGLVFTYMFVPDCRGRSLEDIDVLFHSSVPARRFHKVDVGTLREHIDGHDMKHVETLKDETVTHTEEAKPQV
ncbi:hypothetical protein N7532_000017 [Penicillium argentinense]|uniref:Major facilitator superfamily (MFS) profile domain-containing protein n=1 Tax=Penicillium argentinense TaxID=1131581 RepID=A0A9W9G4Q8_9EURO|nr:uncharacterized protein N7532_000017 [Penicillium argentinense]KAJ5111972.1 hypothetical protein N7532_000017 [Penicillium argentinense]